MTGKPWTIEAVKLSDLDEIQQLFWQLSQGSEDPLRLLQDNKAMVAWQLKRARQSLYAAQKYLAFVARGVNGSSLGYCAGVIEERAPVYQAPLVGVVEEIYIATDLAEKSKLVAALLREIEGAFKALGVGWYVVELPREQQGLYDVVEGEGFLRIREAF